MSNANLVHTGIYFPRETLKKLDERRGRYISRNKYMMKIIEEHLMDDNELKNVDEPKGSTPTAHPTPTPTTPTPTSYASSLMKTATTKDQQRRL
jgi:hypothetical protein